MGVSHMAIFQGNAQQVLAQSATPTNREVAGYDEGNGLEDGDWYFDTDDSLLWIRIGATWVKINFT